MVGVPKTTSAITSTAKGAVSKTESQAATGLAQERAKGMKKQKNTPLGGQKPSETYKKFGFFGYFFLAIEALIIISLFAFKDIVDWVDTATILAAGVGEGLGEIISTALGFILGAIVFVWLWFRFGRSKKGSEAAKTAAKQGLKILGSYVGVWVADIIPVVEKMPWLTIYGIILYGMEFYKMATKPNNAQSSSEEEAAIPPPKSSLRAELQQKTQNNV